MSESNDTLAVLLIFAAFLHTLTLLGMTLHTALAVEKPHHDRAPERPLTALFLGLAPVQRTGRSTFISCLLAASGLLLASASVMSLANGAPPVWTTILAVLAGTELASAYAWHKAVSANSSSAAEPQPDEAEEAPERAPDITDSDDKEATKGPGAN
ncbi:hypothetical protein [Streptomyces sp. NPDC051546]|uniref:hypothetical protein n=1 Tax=Streptomyces sp. NPDC051546 TaxID=3365655 RepID=UPI0037BB0C0A